MSENTKKHAENKPVFANRKRNIAILIALLIVAGIVVFFTARSANNDAQPLNTKKAVIAQKTLVQDIGPTKGTFAGLITPATTEWWPLVTSAAPQLQLWTAKAPDALWYGTTSGKAYSSTDKKLNLYQAVHLGFKTADDAQKFLNSIGGENSAQNRQILIRGNVITFVPVWLDPQNEPYQKTSKALANAALSMKPQTAYWSINYGEQNQQLAASSPRYGQNYLDFVHSLGYTDTTSWVGTANTPDDYFTGTIQNYDADKINILDATKALVNTITYQCLDGSIKSRSELTSDEVNNQSCNPYEDNLNTLPQSFFLDKGNGGKTDETYGADRQYLPANPPSNTVFYGGQDSNQIQGIVNSTTNSVPSPLQITQFFITDDNTMMLKLVPYFDSKTVKGKNNTPSEYNSSDTASSLTPSAFPTPTGLTTPITEVPTLPPGKSIFPPPNTGLPSGETSLTPGGTGTPVPPAPGHQ